MIWESGYDLEADENAGFYMPLLSWPVITIQAWVLPYCLPPILSFGCFPLLILLPFHLITPYLLFVLP